MGNDMLSSSMEKESIHGSEIDIIERLLECRQNYIDSVTNYEKARKSELSLSKAEWDHKLAGFKNERDICERKRLEDINREIDYFKKKKEDRQKSYANTLRELESQIDQIKKKLDVLGKLKKFSNDDPVMLLKAKKCFLDAVTELEKVKEQETASNEKDSAEMMAVYERNLADIEAASEKRLNEIDERKRKETSGYDDACREIEKKYSEKLEKNNEEFEKLLHDNSDNYRVDEYLRKAGEYIVTGNNFICPEEMSDYIHFGNLFVNMDKTYETAKGFDRIFLNFAKDITTDDAKKMIVRLPYLQEFEDGVSLIIKHNGSNYTKEILKDIVLKTLMYYPAGKVAVTMIDPKGLGGSFSGLGRLGGDKNTWLRDTKIWSEEEEIEAAIDRFRETAENWIQIYGGDKKALIKKEQLKILAVMDFPQHFTQRALDSLSAVIRNCRDTGTIIYIMTGKDEFDELINASSERKEDFRNCQVIEQQGDDNDFVLAEHPYMHITFDGFGDIRKNSADIIATISKEADSYQPPIVAFSSLYEKDMLDSNYWFTGNPRSFSIPIGYHSFNAPMSLSFGAVNDTKQNILIEGMPRSGKTNLLHNIILGGLLNYNPQYLQFYLIDFKDGVEFREYADYCLPGIKVIAVDAQREFALSILDELVDEMTRRNNEFGRIGTNDIESYNRSVDAAEIMPRLILIFDEVTALFNSSDPVSEACLEGIMKIQTKGGNVGIHTILATQDYNQCSLVDVDRDFSLAKVRIVTFGRDDTKCSILKSTDGMAIGRIGSALFNDNGGEASNNRYMRVATSKREALPEGEPTRQDYLERLDEYFERLRDVYSDYETHVWTQDMEKNPNIYFNQVILNADDEYYLSDTRLVPGKDVGILLGNGIRSNFHIITLKQQEKENMLMLGMSEGSRMMESIIISMVLSIACECTIKNKTRSQVYILDGSVRSGAEHRDRKRVKLSDMSKLFEMVDYFRVRDDSFIALLKDLSDEIDTRIENSGSYDPVYLFVNKIDDMEMYFGKSAQGSGKEDGRNLLNKILLRGPAAGVHVIMTGEYYDVVVSDILGDNINEFFNKRIAIHFEDSTKQFHLVYKREVTASHNDKIAVIYDRISDEAEVDMFSVYDVPDYSWVEQIADALM